MTGVWEPVHQYTEGRGPIIYWRFVVDGRQVGAYSRKPDGFRALLYRPHQTALELGMFPTWREARRAVQRAAAN